MRISDWSSDVCSSDLSEMRLLASSGLRYRRQILALKHFFSHRNCTVLLLDDTTMEPGDAHLHRTVHGVIGLEVLTQAFGAERRRLRIDRKTVVEGKRLAVRVDPGGGGSIKTKK